MRSVLLSIQPKWCELIANGKKSVEVRKTRPKCDVPFKVYIYCTKNTEKRIGHWLNLYCDSKQVTTDIKLEEPCYPLNGKVIGEFVCDEIKQGVLSISEYVDSVNIESDKTCLSVDEIKAYLGMRYFETKGQHGFYGWHISDLVIYDEPKELSEFRKYNPFFEGISTEELEAEGVLNVRIKRPPQSWCYVEGGAEDV